MAQACGQRVLGGPAMTDRDELIEKGVYAIREAWEAETDGPTDAGFAAAVIAAVEPIIRADERRKARSADATMGYMREAVDEALSDLPDRVKALPRVTDDYYREAVLLEHVLALLGKEVKR